MPSEVECKNQRVQIQLDSKLDFNWSLIFCHVSIYHFLFLWQVNYWVQKLKSLKPIKFYIIDIYIYNEKPLHILEMYGLKKV